MTDGTEQHVGGSAATADATGAAGGDEGRRGPIVRAAIGIGLYAAVFGTSFGAVATALGLSVGQTVLLSVVMFSGASQFAFAGVAAAGLPWAAVPAALLLGVRNGFYGVALTETLRREGADAASAGPRTVLRRLATAHFVIDETTALALAQPTRAAGRFAFWASGLILFVLWNAGTLAGALLGAAIDPATFGLDAAAPAVFLALLWPMLRRPGGVRVALGGAVVALLLAPLVPPGLPVIAAALVALVAGLAGRRPAAAASTDGSTGPDARAAEAAEAAEVAEAAEADHRPEPSEERR